MVKIKDRFKNSVKGLKDYVLLITTSAEEYQKTNLEVIKYLINEEKIPGVYVTLNKPWQIVQRLLKNNKINDELILFIDGVTQIPSKSNKRIPKCLFIGSPEKLSDMSVAMDQAVKALTTNEKFIFFDSLNTLTIYNSAATVARFVHFLVSKMREWKIKGIIISLKKEKDKELINELTTFCDVSINLGR